jgi:hypothetical protein
MVSTNTNLWFALAKARENFIHQLTQVVLSFDVIKDAVILIPTLGRADRIYKFTKI